ncbi:DNA glycosylase [Microbacterium sp. TS-1]|uniref:PD-(D/E)XK nuclease family protein n=1 Tax=Microbacterium sp. TS-1 TaxID=1344956 RepID=UPI00038FC706|nr:PD-(D/E)XK nuclease family protein [Microbacterium sp. TS-1]GAD34405.1 DNA glycosylase [Microbacterium sp. TS-1]
MAQLNETRLYDTGISYSLAVLPAVPAMWSYSSLKEAETCPRRFALARADYPELWAQRGYPRVPNLAAMKGDVVHGALQVIVTALVTAGCVSPRSADAVTVLRDLGGYTAVAQCTLDEQLGRLDGNPRISADRREQVGRALSDWLPEAREQIQSYLNRMTLRPRPAPVGAQTELPAKRYPIRGGTYSERELVAAHLRVKGRVDVLSVDADGAEITDTKTGAEDPTRLDQLRLYAVVDR